MYIDYSELRWNVLKQDFKGESVCQCSVHLERWNKRRLEALKCVCSVLRISGGTLLLWKLVIGFEMNTRSCRARDTAIEPDFGVEGSLAV